MGSILRKILVPFETRGPLLELYGIWIGPAKVSPGTKIGAPWPGAGYQYEVQRQAEALVLEAMSHGTGTSYTLGWNQWLSYCRLRGMSPFLEGTSRTERRQDEEEILYYIVYLGISMNRAASTVKTKLAALRQGHIVAGCGDPIEGKKRVLMAIKGLEKRNGRGRRKLPTTTGMLLSLIHI